MKVTLLYEEKFKKRRNNDKVDKNKLQNQKLIQKSKILKIIEK